jgi:hypothetical protein
MSELAARDARESKGYRYATGDQDFDDLNRSQSLLSGQDERGLALALGAFAEETLGRLLLTYLRQGKQSEELVEGFNAPLGTLATRIKAAYALGLLTREQYQDLEIARKVRNAFAHDWEAIALDRQDIRAMIDSLHGYTLYQAPLEGGPRDRFVGSITTILVELRIQIAQHRKHARRVPFVGFRLTTTKPEGS